MRIVIDLQGAQSSGSARRGIGRYSTSLARAMAGVAGSHEIVLALNSHFPEMIHEVRQCFDGLVDPNNIRLWHPPAQSDNASPAALRAAERLYEAFLARLQPDVVHVSSLFEGLNDRAITSIGKFAIQPTAVTLYDLIPLLNPQKYLAHPPVHAWYSRKIDSLRRADMCLAISESSRQEGIQYLGMLPERCINISTAAYEHFKQLEIPPVRASDLRMRYGLKKPFVMYTGGIDVRKNLEGLIRAFSMLPAQLRRTYQLAIVCAASAESKKLLIDLARSLGLADGELILTGFVPEDDLVGLYNLCELFVFPSWHEGFGLPALEAMQCGAVVIGANTSSLPEVIGREDALFDPRDDSSMAKKMERALSDVHFRAELITHGLAQAKKFTWEGSAKRALAGLEALHDVRKDRQVSIVKHRGARPRLAYVSPLPPQRSGIADYSAQLLPELALYYDIELIVDQSSVTDVALSANFPIREIEWFCQHYAEFDRVLYHFGNSSVHTHMFDLLEQAPGVVVLHDFFLSGLLAYRQYHEGHSLVWQKSLYASHGYFALLDHANATDSADIVFRYPCNFSVLQRAQGIISHSPYSQELARLWYGDKISAQFSEIPLLRLTQPARGAAQRAEARKAVNVSNEDFLVCCFGIVSLTKLNDRLIKAWNSSKLCRSPNCRLVFVGENDSGKYGAELKQSIANGNVEITGWVGEDKFRNYLGAADLAVQLRTKSRGETSAAVLDAMSYGLPTIVNANGSMAFLPRECVLMLSDDFSDQDLADALEEMWNNPERRESIGKLARSLIETQHAPKKCAKAYADAIEGFASAERTQRNELIRLIRDVDPLPESQDDQSELATIARAISATLPPPQPSRQLLIDVSSIINDEPSPGVVHCLSETLLFLLSRPIINYRIEPIFRKGGENQYVYARKFTLSLLKCHTEVLADTPVEFYQDDALVIVERPFKENAEQLCLQNLAYDGLQVHSVNPSNFVKFIADHFSQYLSEEQRTELLQTDVRTAAPDDDAQIVRALGTAGIYGLERADFNHLLHHLRGEEIAQLPQGVECFISVGCAGTWYFKWIQERCSPRLHVGIEYYSPKPDDLPANVVWITNTAGDMSSIADATGDILFSGQNIEHLWPYDIAAFLRESHRVLKPEGLLVIDSPNRSVTAALSWSHPEHILEFTPSEARDLVSAAGFEVVDVRGAWACQDPATSETLPLSDMTAEGSWPLRRRVEVARNHPECAFSWWLEARRTSATPDWERVEYLVSRAFEKAWPERVNRLTALNSELIVRGDETWLRARGTPGLMMFGPSMPLPKGDYEVTFQLQGQGSEPHDVSPIAALNVIDGTGAELASRIVNAGALAVDCKREFTLAFALVDTTFGIQFRVMSLSAAPVECRQRVQLKSSTDSTYSTEFESESPPRWNSMADSKAG